MIVCVGTTPVWQRSMSFERLRLNDVNRAAVAVDYASGKSINVARVLSYLGEDGVRAMGFVGGDTGKAILAYLRREGIRRSFIRFPGATRQCITVIDRSNGTATELVEEAMWVGEQSWRRLGEKLDKWLPRAKACVLSGSLPLDGPQDFYLSCLQRIPAGVPVVVDARGEPLRHALRHGGFIAKLNRDELGTTLGREIDSDARLRAAIREVLPRNGCAVVTAGAEGAVIARRDGAWRVRPPRVLAKSAVGSGDAFAAGMVLKLVAGAPVEVAATFGAACGAANALSEIAGWVAQADVERLLPQVVVEPF